MDVSFISGLILIVLAIVTLTLLISQELRISVADLIYTVQSVVSAGLLILIAVLLGWTLRGSSCGS
jgi:hypothetical protein